MENEKFKSKLVQHKKLIGTMIATKDIMLCIPIKVLAEELSLVYADFKCENDRCKSETNVQWHHLIGKRVEKYTDKLRYLSQRHYWANILILCLDCHARIEGRETDESKVISRDKINKIKKKYQE